MSTISQFFTNLYRPLSIDETIRFICAVILYGIPIIDLTLCARKIKRLSARINNDTFQCYSAARTGLISRTTLFFIIGAALTVPYDMGMAIGLVPPSPTALYLIGIAAMLVATISLRCIGLFCSSHLMPLLVTSELFQFATSDTAKRAVAGFGVGCMAFMFVSFFVRPADILGVKFFRKGLLDDIVESLETPNPAPLSPTPTGHIQSSPMPAIRRK